MSWAASCLSSGHLVIQSQYRTGTQKFPEVHIVSVLSCLAYLVGIIFPARSLQSQSHSNSSKHRYALEIDSQARISVAGTGHLATVGRPSCLSDEQGLLLRSMAVALGDFVTCYQNSCRPLSPPGAQSPCSETKAPKKD